jgi:hypothetical protein
MVTSNTITEEVTTDRMGIEAITTEEWEDIRIVKINVI